MHNMSMCVRVTCSNHQHDTMYVRTRMITLHMHSFSRFAYQTTCQVRKGGSQLGREEGKRQREETGVHVIDTDPNYSTYSNILSTRYLPHMINYILDREFCFWNVVFLQSSHPLTLELPDVIIRNGL